MLLKIKFAIFYLIYFEKYLLYKLVHPGHAEEYLVEKAFYPRLAMKLVGVPIGTNTRISNGLVLHNYTKGNLSIGNNVHIGKGVLLDLTEKITIQDNCTISMGTKILTHQNLGDSSLSRQYPFASSPILFEESAYIGANSLILHSTKKISQKTLLASNSMLDKMTEENTMYAGNPAVSKKNLAN